MPPLGGGIIAGPPEGGTRNEAQAQLRVYRNPNGLAFERIGLVLPASLCSGQVARLAAARLNERLRGGSIDRFVALAHTEGCGFSGDSLYRMLLRTYRGYLTHSSVAAALVLEHGCEKVPNDLIRRDLANSGVDPRRFGWASVQLDGGIERVLEVVERWFAGRLAEMESPPPLAGGFEALALAMATESPVSEYMVRNLVDVARVILAAGGSVLIPASDAIARAPAFLELLANDESSHVTLAGGEPMARGGLHLVETESEHLVENITALVGCGASISVVAVAGHPCAGHPLVPVLQVAERGRLAEEDVDLEVSESDEVVGSLLRLLVDTANGSHVPAASVAGVVDFQFTRGFLGVTT